MNFKQFKILEFGTKVFKSVTLQIPKLEGKFWTIQKKLESITYEFNMAFNGKTLENP